MTELESTSAARECEIFCAYLTGVGPDSYVRQKYAEAHCVTADYRAEGRFEQFLVRFAAGGAQRALVADTYASFFARGSALRRKLILLAAILESLPPERGFIETVSGANPALLFLRMIARGVLFLLRLLLATLLLGPIHLALGRARRAGGR